MTENEWIQLYVKLQFPLIALYHPNNPYPPKHCEKYRASKDSKAGKIPLYGGWQIPKYPNIANIQDWKRKCAGYVNYGLLLGYGYIGIDVDGKDGERLWEKLSQKYEEDGNTWKYTTGEGFRLIYKLPEGIETKKCTVKEGIKLEGHNEVAIITKGQQTVIPPSYHASKETYYTWIDGMSPKDMECKLASPWIIDLIKVEQDTVETMDISGEPTSTKTRAKSKVDLYVPIIEGNGGDNAITAVIGHFLSKPEYREPTCTLDEFKTFIRNYNIEWCQPPFDERTIDKKVETLWKKEHSKHKDKEKDLKFNDSLATDEYLEWLQNVKEKKIFVVKNMVYFTDLKQGPYNRMEDKISGAIGGQPNPLSEWTTEYLSQSKYNDGEFLNKVMRIHCMIKNKPGFTKREEDIDVIYQINEKGNKDYFNRISFNNGILDLRDMQLFPWDGSWYTPFHFDMDYDEEADCPHFKQYMKDWLPDQGQRDLLLEFCGYCLIPGQSPEEAFMILTGETSHGKSVFVNCLKLIFGGLTSHLSLVQMTKTYENLSLLGSLLNIDNESGLNFRGHENLFKQLTGESKMTFNTKYGSIMQAYPTAKLLFVSNDEVQHSDKSGAFARRSKQVRFDQDFRNSKITTGMLIDNVRKERAGVINYFIEYLLRLRIQGLFTVTEENINQNLKAQRQADPIYDFSLMAFSKVEKSVTMSLNMLYGLYKSFNSKFRSQRYVTFKNFKKYFDTHKQEWNINSITISNIEFPYKINQKFIDACEITTNPIFDVDIDKDLIIEGEEIEI